MPLAKGLRTICEHTLGKLTKNFREFIVIMVINFIDRKRPSVVRLIDFQSVELSIYEYRESGLMNDESMAFYAAPYSVVGGAGVRTDWLW